MHFDFAKTKDKDKQKQAGGSTLSSHTFGLVDTHQHFMWSLSSHMECTELNYLPHYPLPALLLSSPFRKLSYKAIPLAWSGYISSYLSAKRHALEMYPFTYLYKLAHWVLQLYFEWQAFSPWPSNRMLLGFFLAQNSGRKLACANDPGLAFTLPIGGTFIVVIRTRTLMLWFLCWDEWLLIQRDPVWLLIAHCSGYLFWCNRMPSGWEYFCCH